MQINRALLSVSNKEGIVELASFLHANQIEIISTGGTAKIIRDNNIPVTPIEEITGTPEAFGGRMKTLSFQIESALLYRRNNPQDILDAEKLGVKRIDLVVCNLYPFEEVAQTTTNHTQLIDNIDIGGPCMIRAAAKNHDHVAVLTHPKHYQDFMQHFSEQNLTFKIRLNWAIEAFKLTAYYDQYIFNTLNINHQVSTTPLALEQLTPLRYGENPHQKAWLAKWDNSFSRISISRGEQLHGKQLSFNNLVDADAAWKCTSEMNLIYPKRFITTIVKHANPCGVAAAKDPLTSLQYAWDCDPVSSFGSIISFNHEVTESYAQWLSDKFIEIIIAPSFSSSAKELLCKKKNIRLIQCENKPQYAFEKVIKSVSGGILIQEEDELQNYEFHTVTNTSFKAEHKEMYRFGMICNKYLKSNSISLIGKREDAYVLAGAGMGQPNRLDSLKMLAGPRAKALGHQMEKLILFSDAFFPFKDSIEVAHELGIKYIIQPGGSIRDDEVIETCNQFQIAMNFTKTRHFRH